MKKILLTLAATAVLSACNLGSLNYSQSQGTYVLEELAGRMAYDGLSIPVQILNSIDWTKTDIFDPSFSGTYALKSQEIKVERVPVLDNTWIFTTTKSNDGIKLNSIYLSMLPDDGSGFYLWEAHGDIYYSEGDSANYEALLSITYPVLYTWKEDIRTAGSRYEKYLVVNGSCSFVTQRSGGVILDKGAYSLTDNEVTPYNGYRLEGKLTLQ